MILKRREKMRAGLQIYHNKRCRGDTFQAFVDDMAAYLPKSVSREGLRASLIPLAGELLTPQLLDETCWRLLGNLWKLSHRPYQVVLPWAVQRIKEWVPVAVLGAKPKTTSRGKHGYLFTFRVLAGSPCPLLLHRFWTNRLCSYVARYMGFQRLPSDKSARPIQRLFRNPTELVGLRLSVLVEPQYSQDGPGFMATEVPPGLRKFNQEQLAYRDRLDDKHPCPLGFSREVACWQCTAGYRLCRAACHREDYQKKTCPGCQKESWFNSEWSQELCVYCFEKKAREGQ